MIDKTMCANMAGKNYCNKMMTDDGWYFELLVVVPRLMNGRRLAIILFLVLNGSRNRNCRNFFVS